MNTTRKNRWSTEAMQLEDEHKYEDENKYEDEYMSWVTAYKDTAEYKDIMKSIEQDPNDSSNYSLLGKYLFKKTKRKVEFHKQRIEHHVKFIQQTKKIVRNSLKSMYKAIELNPDDSVNYSILANMLFNYEILYEKEVLLM